MIGEFKLNNQLLYCLFYIMFYSNVSKINYKILSQSRSNSFSVLRSSFVASKIDDVLTIGYVFGGDVQVVSAAVDEDNVVF